MMSKLQSLPSPFAFVKRLMSLFAVTRIFSVHRDWYGFRLAMPEVWVGMSLRATGAPCCP